MIYRRKYKPNIDCSEISFTLSVNDSDLRKWLRFISEQYHELEDEDFLMPSIFTDLLKFWMRFLPSELVSLIGEWAWQQSLKLGYVVESKFSPNHYKLSRKLVFNQSGTWERPPKGEAITKNFEEGENS